MSFFQRITLNHTIARAGVWCALLAAACGSIGLGQDSTATPADGATRFSDYESGFDVQVPAGWEYDHARQAIGDGGHSVLRGTGAFGQRTLKLLLVRKDREQGFEQWQDQFEQQLSRMPGQAEVERRPLPGRELPHAAFAVDATLAGTPVRSEYRCVQLDPTTVWILAYAGPAGVTAGADSAERAGEDLRAEADAIVASLRVLYTAEEAAALAGARARGRVLLEKLEKLAGRIKIDERESHYLLSIGGEPRGFFSREVRREERSLNDPRYDRKRPKHGLRIAERTWRFDPDSVVRFESCNLFASDDLGSEMIEIQRTTLPPPTSAERLLILLDQSVREGGTLVSSCTTNRQFSLPPPKPPLPTGPNYLSLAWLRLLPAMLGGSEGPAHAFTVYDSATQSMVTQQMRPLGPRTLPESGQPAYAFEGRIGFAPTRTVLYTDERGHLLRLEEGDLVLTLGLKEDIDRRFGPRRTEAEARLERGD